MIAIVSGDVTAPESRELIAALDAELSGSYPEPGATHFGLDPDEVSGGRGAFLLVVRDGRTVGCGAVRRLEAGTAEMKRMYVVPELRGRGLGHLLVEALEARARELGARRLVLETGIRQEVAIALYRAMGYRPIPLFGEYVSSPETSICLGKDLKP
jgi:putative acetyltransferase